MNYPGAGDKTVDSSLTPDTHEEIHIPSGTFWPLLFGLGFMGIAFGVIFRVWPLAIAGLAVLMLSMGAWLYTNVLNRMHEPVEHAVAAPLNSTKLAMWLFLGSEGRFFSALIARFLVYRSAATADPRHILDIPLTAGNTFVLLASSLTVVMALASIQRGNRRGLWTFLAATAVLGSTFLGIQAFEYNKLFGEGYTLASNTFGNAFFSLTGFHGMHVLIGVIYCLVMMLRGLRGAFSEHSHLGVEIFGLYWHFVDVVWIMIFTLVYLI